MSTLLTGLKHYGDITVTQRTAVGHDDSDTTTLYLVKGCMGREDVEVMTEERANIFKGCGSEIIGTIAIIHSWLLAGSWDENLNRFIHLAQNKLETDGVIEVNDYGIYFLA